MKTQFDCIKEMSEEEFAECVKNSILIFSQKMSRKDIEQNFVRHFVKFLKSPIEEEKKNEN